MSGKQKLVEKHQLQPILHHPSTPVIPGTWMQPSVGHMSMGRRRFPHGVPDRNPTCHLHPGGCQGRSTPSCSQGLGGKEGACVGLPHGCRHAPGAASRDEPGCGAEPSAPDSLSSPCLAAGAGYWQEHEAELGCRGVMSEAPPVGFWGPPRQGKTREQAQLPALNQAEKEFGVRSVPSRM